MDEEKNYKTLVIDIGASFIKMMLLCAKKSRLSEYLRVNTPSPATVPAVFIAIDTLIKQIQQNFDRIAVGFPGVVENGIIKTAPNMDISWHDFNLQKEFERKFHCPVRVINDADLQGYGYIAGSGVELVIILGTGLGSSLFTDGKLVPNLELAHHPFQNNHTYEQLLGKTALEKIGIDEWNHYLQIAIEIWSRTFNYQQLYLSGGNSEKINCELPALVKRVRISDGFAGGVVLWTVAK